MGKSNPMFRQFHSRYISQCFRSRFYDLKNSYEEAKSEDKVDNGSGFSENKQVRQEINEID